MLDAQALTGHMMPAGSVYAFLAEHRSEVFPDGMFADLFPSGRGRPSVPGSVIASVLVLQTLQFVDIVREIGVDTDAPSTIRFARTVGSLQAHDLAMTDPKRSTATGPA